MKKLFVIIFLLVFLPVAHASESNQSVESKSSRSWLDDLFSIPTSTVQATGDLVANKIFGLGEVVVVGDRVSGLGDVSATDYPGNITILGQTQIDEVGSDLLPEVLSRTEGVTYSDDLGGGTAARVDLRGFGGEAKAALVLFDGVRAVEPFDNSVSWHLYPSEYIESVEVRRGGGTIFGEGALSGVISMRTKQPTKEPHAAFEASYGSFNSQKYFVEASSRVADTGLYIGSRYYDSEGYRQNASHESNSILAKIHKKISEWITAENSFYFVGNETGIAGPLLAQEVAQDRRQKDPDGQFGDLFSDRLVEDHLILRYYAEPINAEITNQLGWRLRNQDSTQSFGGAFPGISMNQIETETYSDVLQASWLREWEPIAIRVSAGVEWSIDDIYNPYSFLDLTFGPFDSERSIDRRMIGGFLQGNLTLWECLIVEAGVRVDDIHWDIYDLKTPSLEKQKQASYTSPRVGVEYKIFAPLAIFADYSEAFKVPDANTLIFETPHIFSPNPDVDPSVARHYEAGARYAHPVLGSVRVSAFYIETDKEILFNDISNRNENFDTRRQGVEVAEEIAIRENLQVYFNYTFTDAEFSGESFDGRSVPLVPESRWSAGVLAQPLRGWSTSLAATAVDGQYALNDFNNVFPVDDYWILGARVAYKKDTWEIYAKGENILSEEYSSFVTSDGVSALNLNPAPEAYFEMGVKIRI